MARPDCIDDRLIRHDRRLIANAASAAFSSWGDRLLVGGMALAALGVIRSSIADRAPADMAWGMLAVGALLGFWAARLIEVRLAFHISDGPIAADALQPHLRRRFRTAWHMLGLAVVGVAMLAAGPWAFAMLAVGWFLGMATAPFSATRDMNGVAARTARAGRTIRVRANRPSTGAAAAMLLSAMLLSVRDFHDDAIDAAVGGGSLFCTIGLATVDHAIVRFMTVTGQPTWRILLRHAGGLAVFAGIAVPLCGVAIGGVAAALVAGMSAVGLLLLVLRVLAYRLHGRRIADLVVGGVGALSLLVALLMPMLLPILLPAILWDLARRGRGRTWLLA